MKTGEEILRTIKLGYSGDTVIRWACCINEWDDSIDLPAPCQPIGCDADMHLQECFYDEEWEPTK